jgi:hypothetical protein
MLSVQFDPANRGISGKAFNLSIALSASDANELDAHWTADLGGCAGVRELAGLGVDAEDGHRVAVLIGDKKKTSRRIYNEIARGLAQAGMMLDKRQSSRRLVNGVDDQAVMAAIRSE